MAQRRLVLASDAVKLLIRTERELRPIPGPSIVLGALQDPATGNHVLGCCSAWPEAHRVSTDRSWECTSPGQDENGNIVLVPRDVTQHLGTIDRAYRHGIADYFYYRLRGAAVET